MSAIQMQDIDHRSSRTHHCLRDQLSHPATNALLLLIRQIDVEPSFEGLDPFSLRATLLDDLRLSTQILLDRAVDKHPLPINLVVSRSIVLWPSQELHHQDSESLEALWMAPSVPKSRKVKASALFRTRRDLRTSVNDKPSVLTSSLWQSRLVETPPFPRMRKSCSMAVQCCSDTGISRTFFPATARSGQG